ncbi:DNA helicase-2/ATP-dependent DNA helicase PcrA [Kineosphaera limosa]|uniref:DNA 3'-5' helicase n=1 Tax=Kineosphaera limosa NBRC 100340 TaxID=1184609 RepID=K6WCG4_9MICO|nr:ATP-dependent DNA helicase [Kineosphaera limosa]NYE00833.1 DNA helicase-2/ATP-dependent DNA helicase PcrA [Kineosphaera limosa]GAB96960.1 putative ATP-dependent DNA helicase [Kineosphaera limosa NBRC 100340]
MPTYTPSQSEAIACVEEPLQIIACAGSGKTQVISQRIADLLASGRAEPRNIVAFTFTERAAAELKDRIVHLVEEAGTSTVGLAEMFIGTMHGYCLDLLQRNVPETFKYNVLTDITARLLVDRNSRQSGLTTCEAVVNGTPKKLRRFVNSRLYLSALGIFREDDVDQNRVPSSFKMAFEAYTHLLRTKGYLDYTAMIQLAVEMLENLDPEDDDSMAQALHGYVRDGVKFLVVDEYQDVNPLQERLIRALTQFGANLCVVGDDDQTIYQWRGSEVSNIITFARRHASVRQVTLDDNFRSSRGVVELGRSIAETIPVGDRLAKRMVASGHQEWERGDLLALDFGTENDEVRWICDRIEGLRGVSFCDSPSATPRGLSWSDCAVLYRSVSADAGPLVDELRRRDIPFVIKGLNRLFDSPEVAAVVNIFDYMVETISAAGLRTAWETAELIPTSGSWDAAVAVLDTGRDFERGQRWGIYNIQRVYLDFLEALGIREDNLPGQRERRELAFYQLGKFSQVISDFEEIHFSSTPAEKYQAFAKWLQYQAPDYYADVDDDVGYATPDAVTISTVHQAKGMQWPAVFVPCLRRNRFPSKRQGGLNVFHVIPESAIPGADRYKGTRDDEARLFYVAITRAQKYLHITYSPGAGKFYGKRSEFFDHCTRHSLVSTRDPGLPAGGRLTPQPKVEAAQITLSFSELKYYFECPYQFKMRFLYGFNAPLHEALGYGKGLHDALSEVHKRAIHGDLVTVSSAKDLVDRHLHTPYAYPELRKQLERSAIDAVARYLTTHGDELALTLHSEQPIQVHLGDGVVVDGRVDLIRRLDTDEVSIVDFKSTDRAQQEEVTRDQLHIYAVGYQELKGERADLIEVLNLDPGAKSTREQVDDALLTSIRDRIQAAGTALRENDLPRHVSWCGACESCDFVALCRPRESNQRDGAERE